VGGEKEDLLRNLASQKFLEKAGLRKEGFLRRFKFIRGKWRYVSLQCSARRMEVVEDIDQNLNIAYLCCVFCLFSCVYPNRSDSMSNFFMSAVATMTTAAITAIVSRGVSVSDGAGGSGAVVEMSTCSVRG
jgi:hypothetical protein